jgi:hypothetical protein
MVATCGCTPWHVRHAHYVLLVLCRSRLHMRPLSLAAAAQLLCNMGSLPMVMGVAQC